MPLRPAKSDEPIPGYRLIERLGRGGFGEVWKAEAPGGLLKAIKFVYGDLEGAGEDGKAAEQELKALNRVKTIRHPYILSLERYDIVDGQLLIVMELADRNLWDRFRECKAQGLEGIPREELLRYMEETAEALDLMNQQYQIQHLDIKPQNLFLIHNHIKVADFGLAKDFEGMRATVTGGVTPVYAAPETFEGWISRFSDQYSLAIVYQELLTGQRPYNGTNTRQLMMQHLSGTPDLSGVPPGDREALARALSKKPDDRFPSCLDLVKALKHSIYHASPETISTPPVAPSQPPLVSSTGTGSTATVSLRPPTSSLSSSTPPKGLPPLRPPGSAGLPSLTTPRPSSSSQATPLVTPTKANTTGVVAAPLTQLRPLVTQTQRMSSLGLAAPERTGEGVLKPALIVSIGRTGLIASQQLRQLLHDRFGSQVNLPHLRWLHLDTDAEDLQAATSVPPPLAMNPKDLILARLNRPGHYIKREGLPAVDTWLSNQVLYRMPRNPATNNIRAFGRLAFCDHYKTISQRLHAELEALLADDVLAEADKQTGLGLRSSRPRVYVIANLAGATGGGMYLDLAYVIRHELRQFGISQPDVVGMLMVPHVDRSVPKSLAIVNAFAALLELYHYSSPFSFYEAKLDTKQPPLQDADRPFVRCALVPLPKNHDSRSLRQTATMLAASIYQEMFTPIGRVLDESRSAYQVATPIQGPPLQSFGLYRLTWPRQRVLEIAVRKLVQRVLAKWISKETHYLKEPIANWLEQEWIRRGLDMDTLLGKLRDAARQAIQNDPELVFDGFLTPLLDPKTGQPGRFDALTACESLDLILRLVGKPDVDKDTAPGTLSDALQATVPSLIADAEVKLAEMAVYFIEQPQYRFPGAEEAIRQIIAKLRGTIETLEQTHRGLDEELRADYARIFQLIGILQTSSRVSPTLFQEIVQLLQKYPRKRYQFVQLASILSVYRGLMGNAPEYLREVNFCRLRIQELAQSFLEADKAEQVEVVRGPGQYVLPPGCHTSAEAAEEFLDELTPAEIDLYDNNVQSQIRRQFRALVNICIETKDHGPALRTILYEQAEQFLNSRLERANPAEVFFRYRPDLQAAAREIAQAYDEACPDLLGPRARAEAQVFVLGVPPDEFGQEFRQMTREVLPDVDLVVAESQDAIVFYREQRHLPLSDLPQFSVFAREAYEEALRNPSEEAVTPHSRMDVHWLDPGSGPN